ncbi:MAG: ATP-binding protein [Candidatus Kariarchaeaceae archaeon]|jgi:Pyruvate/2-oxoacid:ferredoxin oxidoreductase delta subunit
MGDAVQRINPNLGRLVSKEEAKEHVQKCTDAGLVHLIGRNKIDEVWLDAKPGNKLLTICNCCPCCCLWKILPDLNPQISSMLMKMPGVNVQVHQELCKGCGSCSKDGVCFAGAIQMIGDTSYISDGCRGCARCVSICPNRAIELEIQIEQSVSETIDEISPLVEIGNE